MDRTTRGDSAAPAQASNLTAGEVVERIQRNVGVPWRGETVDTFKAGGPETVVTGIATTFMSTVGVLQRAAAAGRNMVVTHEPTYYGHLDETKDLTDDPVYRAKLELIQRNGLVIFRFHDHWHQRSPDGIFRGFSEALGWRAYQAGDNMSFDESAPPITFTLPTLTLQDLVAHVRTRLGSRATRVVGDPKAVVSTVALALGTPGKFTPRLMRDIDVVMTTEAREWEWVPYVEDAVSLKRIKGLILPGHGAVEEPGMAECARWLRTFISEVPIDHVPSGEPFWQPELDPARLN